MRQSIISAARPALRSSIQIQSRGFAMSASRMAGTEGATGGTRSGGETAGDAFSKREKAQEDFAIKAREREKLVALKAKIAAQQKSLDELSKNLDDIEKGEQSKQ